MEQKKVSKLDEALSKVLTKSAVVPETRKKSNDEIALEQMQREVEDIKNECLGFSGEVLAFVYRPHNGFANFAIVNLKLKDGEVEDVVEVTQPHAAFEIRAHMETKQAYKLEKMRQNYPSGFQHV